MSSLEAYSLLQTIIRYIDLTPSQWSSYLESILAKISMNIQQALRIVFLYETWSRLILVSLKILASAPLSTP